MFVYDEEARTFWFNSATLESSSEFELIGIILGAAIYNGVILDIHFPPVVYKKLLNYKPTLQDLLLINPVGDHLSCNQHHSSSGDSHSLRVFSSFLSSRATLKRHTAARSSLSARFGAPPSWWTSNRTDGILRSPTTTEKVDAPFTVLSGTQYGIAEYVDLMVQYLLTDSIAQQYKVRLFSAISRIF